MPPSATRRESNAYGEGYRRSPNEELAIVMREARDLAMRRKAESDKWLEQ